MERIIFSEQGGEHPVVVVEEEHVRCLRFGTGARQSCMDTLAPHRLQLAYTRWMMTALLLHPQPERFLVLGLGGGSLVRFLLHHHPGARIDVVEKSAEVIRIARAYFQLPQPENLRILHLDAADFAARLSGPGTLPYHVAFVDLFGPDCMAGPVFEPEFHNRVLHSLAPDGVMAVNLWSGDRRRFLLARRAITVTCPGRVLKLQVKKRSNVILLAFPHRIPKSRLRRVRKNILPLQQRYGLDFARYLKRLRRTNPDLLAAVTGRA
ncbi:MAG TPA: hypothetical protein ENI89_00445 [Desulfobulbus sp.]|nr:hypothetical protein [Desulfobulbus sp.]